MKKKMQEDILLALKVIENGGLLKSGKLPNEYKGYISSFGAAVGQSGLLPATMIFSEKPSNNRDGTKQMRCKLMRAIYDVMIGAETPSTDDHILLIHAKNPNVYRNPKEVKKILDSAIALKMAMRAYASEETQISQSEINTP